jgi:hypothetical protein
LPLLASQAFARRLLFPVRPHVDVSAAGEYLYYKFTGGTSAIVNAGGVAPAGTFTTHNFGNLDVNVVRLGMNYKFNWWR